MRRALDWKFLIATAVLISVGFLVYSGTRARENENRLVAELTERDALIVKLTKKSDLQDAAIYALALEVAGLRSELRANNIDSQTPSTGGTTASPAEPAPSTPDPGQCPAFVCTLIKVGC